MSKVHFMNRVCTVQPLKLLHSIFRFVNTKYPFAVKKFSGIELKITEGIKIWIILK